MKTYIVSVLLFLSCSTTLSAQENDRNSILALSVDLYTNTIARVTCDNYIVAFGRIFITNVVSQNDSITQFSRFIQQVKYARHDRGIDVRCKFIQEMDDIYITVCTDGMDILVNGRLIRKNKRFINFLNSIVHRDPNKYNWQGDGHKK